MVDSTAQGLKAWGQCYQPPRLFLVTLQKPWVNQFVVHLHPLIGMHSTLASMRHLWRWRPAFLDRLELGWSMVAEYNAEELADDSKNKKRLEKADQWVEWKAAKRKKCVSSQLPSSGVHALCPIQLRETQLCWTIPTCTRHVAVASSDWQKLFSIIPSMREKHRKTFTKSRFYCKDYHVNTEWKTLKEKASVSPFLQSRSSF